MDPLQSKAYGIFVGEFERHMREMRTVFEKNEAFDQNMLRRAVGAFHTVKGGAGFFGLQQVADLAAETEKILRDPAFDVARQRAVVLENISNLEKLHTEISAKKG
jgi:chemotaxis protein histidine kinase CheA